MAAYDAFISYSHLKDKPIASALQSVIQTLGKAWYTRRSLRIFRDDTSLSATPHLWPTIETALGDSRFLILLASFESARSIWVGKEVAHWLEHKSTDTLLIAVTDGELAWQPGATDFTWSDTTPLPEVLKGCFPHEPKWVDLRAYRGGASKRDLKFMELGADFAAIIHGVPKEDLLSQEVRQQRRALTLAWSAIGLLVLLAAGAAWQWKTAVAERVIAQTQRQRAEDTLNTATLTANSLVTNLAQKFDQRTGMPRDLELDILQQAESLQKKLLDRGETTPDLQLSSAVATYHLSQTLLLLGNSDGAIAAANQAVASLEKLLAPGQPDITSQFRTMAQTDLALAYRYQGNALRRGAGQGQRALAAFQKSAAIAEQLSGAAPTDKNVKLILASAYENIGDAQMSGGKTTDALAEYRKAMVIREQFVPETAAASYGRVGDALTALGQHADALIMYQKAVDAAEKQLAVDPSNAAIAMELNEHYDKLGTALEVSGRFPDALAAFQKAQAKYQELLALDPKNTTMQLNTAESGPFIAGVLVAMGRYGDALAAYQKAQPIFESLAAADPSDVNLQGQLEVNGSQIGQLLMQFGKFADAEVLLQKDVAICEKVTIVDPGSGDWQHRLAVDFAILADAQGNLGQIENAIANYQKSAAILEKLVAADSKNVTLQSDLSIAYEHLGDGLNAAHRPDEALLAYQKEVAIDESLVAVDPSNVSWQLALAIGYVELGDMTRTAGKLDDALAMYQKSLAVAAKLATIDQSNIIWQRQLSITYGRIGLVQRATGKSEDALASDQEMVAIFRKLAAVDLTDLQAQRDLETGDKQFGDVLMDLGRAQDALQAYQNALVVAAQLAIADPKNRARDSDTNAVYLKVATAQIALGQSDQALASYRQGAAIIEKRLSADPGNATWQNALSNDYDAIGTLLVNMGNYDAALTDYKAAAQLAASNAPGYWNRGRAEFFLQQPAAAANDFAKAFQLNSTYAYDALWLHIARQRAGENDQAELSTNAAKISQAVWPWPIVTAYLGSASPADVRALAQSVTDAKTRQSRTCEADFYLGLYQLGKGDQNQARSDLKLAADECPNTFYEGVGAKLELWRLNSAKSAFVVH